MIPYVRLAYASTATANPAHIRNDLIQIFESAQQYNFNHQLTGVLLYGNGYFFQYIEGRKPEVDRLYQHLLKDLRHQGVSLLFYDVAEQLKFDQWGSCYTHFEPPIEHFFRQHQLAGFNPYLLNNQLIHSFLDMLYSRNSNSSVSAMQVLRGLEANQSSYVMSLKDMATVGVLILLILIPLYLIVTLMPSTSGFFLF